jgi:hypothetical protein
LTGLLHYLLRASSCSSCRKDILTSGRLE